MPRQPEQLSLDRRIAQLPGTELAAGINLPVMCFASRKLLKLLVALVLLWQGVMTPAAAYVGCCQSEQPCCVLPAAALACAACAPGAVIGGMLGRFTAAAAAQTLPVFLLTAGPVGAPDDIWRPPRTAASTHLVLSHNFD